MFDIGFSELLLVGVIALLVLGPERLPRVARTAGLWLGRARATAQRFTADIDRELRAEELRQALKEQARQLTEPVAAVQRDLTEMGGDVDAAVSGQDTAKRGDGT